MSKWGAVRLAAVWLAGLAGARASVAADEGEARAVLHAAMADEQRWVRVHAAEVVLEFGERTRVAEAFAREAERHGSEAGYRVGVWRVLAQARPAEREMWRGRVAAVFCDEASADRLFAAETLAKLGEPLPAEARAALRQWATKASAAERVFLNWLEWQGGDAAARGRVVAALGEGDAVARLRAAYVLRFTGSKEPAALAALRAAADREVEGAPSRAFVVGAAFALGVSAERMPVWRGILEEMARRGPPAEAYEALQALRSRADRAELERVRPLLRHAHGDVRVGSAWLILAVLRREP
jgi:SSS family solute:Na+ symporter